MKISARRSPRFLTFRKVLGLIGRLSAAGIERRVDEALQASHLAFSSAGRMEMLFWKGYGTHWPR